MPLKRDPWASTWTTGGEENIDVLLTGFPNAGFQSFQGRHHRVRYQHCGGQLVVIGRRPGQWTHRKHFTWQALVNKCDPCCSVVSVIHLQLGLTISHHADQSLNSFCQWQSGLLGKGGKRHDHAVLLTGLDICSWKNEPCDTLGMNKTNLKLMLVLLSEIRQIHQ